VLAELQTNTTTNTAETKPDAHLFKDDIPEKTFYSVQIAASKVPLNNMKSFLQSMGVQHIMHEQYDGTYYRYCVGEFETVDQAKSALKLIAELGFPDAFVVLFEDGRRCRQIY